MKVSFGYSDSEDRMWIRAGGSGPLWWVTRRFALNLVAQWAALLERTAPAGAQQDAGAAGDTDGGGPVDADAGAAAVADAAAAGGGRAAALRGDRMAAEHRAALARPRSAKGEGDGAGGRDEAPAPPGAGVLVYSVDLGSKDGRIRLVLHSAGQRQAIVTAREDSHRLLAAFVSRCRRNGWLDARLPAWLDRADDSQAGASVV